MATGFSLSWFRFQNLSMFQHWEDTDTSPQKTVVIWVKQKFEVCVCVFSPATESYLK